MPSADCRVLTAERPLQFFDHHAAGEPHHQTSRIHKSRARKSLLGVSPCSQSVPSLRTHPRNLVPVRTTRLVWLCHTIFGNNGFVMESGGAGGYRTV